MGDTATDELFAFDSKYTNLENFYAGVEQPNQDARSGLAKIGDFIKLLGNSLRFRPKQNYSLKSYTVNAVHRGTQSLLDGDKCGPSTVHIFLELFKKLQAGEKIDLDTEFSAPADYDKFLTPMGYKSNLSFSSFMKLAWNNTFSLGSINELYPRSFLDYFMEAPKSLSVWSISSYLLSLKFITTPLISLLTESLSYLRNKLMSLEPNGRFGQYLRTVSMAVVGIPELCLKLFRPLLQFIIQSLLNPIEHFKANWKNSRFTAVISSLCSVAGLGAALFFGAPMALGLLSTVFPIVSVAMAIVPIPAVILGVALLSLFVLKKGFEWGMQKLHSWGNKSDDFDPDDFAVCNEQLSSVANGRGDSFLYERLNGNDLVQGNSDDSPSQDKVDVAEDNSQNLDGRASYGGTHESDDDFESCPRPY
jgi:hypothetical protein